MRGKAGRMTRLIDADALMRAVMAQDVVDKSVAKRLIIQAPTVDAVPVVRCGECKNRDPEDHKCDCGHGILWQLPREDDWFCADGERREE